MGIASPLDVIIYFSIEGTLTRFWFPSTPGRFSLNDGEMILDRKQLLSVGPIGVPNGIDLKTIQWSEGLFPASYDDTYCQYGAPGTEPLPSSHWCVDQIRYLKDNWIPVQMYAGGFRDANGFMQGGWNILWSMYITSFEAWEQGGEPGDMYYNITFTEAKQVLLRTADVVIDSLKPDAQSPFDSPYAYAAPPPAEEAPDDRPVINAYTTRPIGVTENGEEQGQQLWEVAQLVSPTGEPFSIEQIIAENTFEDAPAYEYLANGLPIPVGTLIYLPPGSKAPFGVQFEVPEIQLVAG